MRTNLFLPTLFAFTLFAGAALAEKPTSRLRAHGDMVDRVHRVSSPRGSRAAAPGFARVDSRGASRMSCSDTSVDCASRRSPARTAARSSEASSGPAARPPAFLSKILGSERTSFNEAGEAQAMSARAASRVWSRAGAGSAGGGAPLAHQAGHVRSQEQASTNRSACNEAGECMQSSKASKKEWSYTSVKAGTWKGPEAQRALPGDKAVAAMRAEKSKATETPAHEKSDAK